MNFHEPQSQCTSKVIEQSRKVSKYLKQQQNLLRQLDPVRFVPKAVISSPGIAGLWHMGAEQGGHRMGEEVKCPALAPTLTPAVHATNTSESICLSLIIQTSPTLTASIKFLGGEGDERVKTNIQSERQHCWVS